MTFLVTTALLVLPTTVGGTLVPAAVLAVEAAAVTLLLVAVGLGKVVVAVVMEVVVVVEAVEALAEGVTFGEMPKAEDGVSEAAGDITLWVAEMTVVLTVDSPRTGVEDNMNVLALGSSIMVAADAGATVSWATRVAGLKASLVVDAEYATSLEAVRVWE